MIQLLMNNLMPILSLFFGTGGFIAWFFERRKRKAQAISIETQNESQEIANDKSLIALYKEALDDLNGRYERKFKEITDMYERKIKLLEDEINLHKRIIANLRKENSDLRGRIKELEAKK